MSISPVTGRGRVRDILEKRDGKPSDTPHLCILPPHSTATTASSIPARKRSDRGSYSSSPCAKFHLFQWTSLQVPFPRECRVKQAQILSTLPSVLTFLLRWNRVPQLSGIQIRNKKDFSKCFSLVAHWQTVLFV